MVKEVLRYRAPAPMVPQVRLVVGWPWGGACRVPCGSVRCAKPACSLLPSSQALLPVTHPRHTTHAPSTPLQMAYADYPLGEEYSIPKGTLVFPSINAANMQVGGAGAWVGGRGLQVHLSRRAGRRAGGSRRMRGLLLADAALKVRTLTRTHHAYPPPALLQGFPNAEYFDPDRMGPERKEDIIHAKNFLTFGYGPHYCVGESTRAGAADRQGGGWGLATAGHLRWICAIFPP